MMFEQQKTQHRVQCRIILNTTADRTEFTPEAQEAVIDAVAKIVQCPREELHLVNIHDERTALTVEMPEKVFERFVTLGQTGNSDLKDLGITQAREVLQDYYVIDNIRRMLSNMFTAQAFQAFCQRYFAPVSASIASETNKAVMIDTLLTYARQNSRIPHVLSFTQQHNAKIYARYEPYYETPRGFPSQHNRVLPIPSRSSRPRPRFFTLTGKEMFESILLGLGVAAGMSFLLQRVLMTPVHENFADLWYFLEGAKAFTGILVAEVVLKAAHSKRGKLLAIISVSCYVLGYILGASLSVLSFSGGSPSGEEFVFGFASALSSLALLIGIYLAYRYTR